MEPTAARVRELLSCDPASGEFVWLPRAGYDRLTKSWNARYAGAQAGSIDRGKGYVYISLDGRNYNASRLAWLYVTGNWPADVVDHINGARADNRFCNLREATLAQNNVNRRAFGISGLKGAYSYRYVRGQKRWASCIRADGVTHFLGRFSSAEEAHEAYAIAARRLHGEFARVS